MLARQTTLIRIPHISTFAAFALMVLALVWFLNTTIQSPLIPTDDAFITYRYAANFAHGEGLVYNQGEHVLGTTAPGYAMLLSAIARVTGVELLPAISRWVNLVAVVAAGGCAFALAQQIIRNVLVSCAVFIIVLLSPATLIGVLSGMESPVFLAMIALALWALMSQHWRLAAFTLALLPLIRPEGAFVIALCTPIFAINYKQLKVSRRTLTESLLLLLLPGMIWAAFCTAYYGSPIPHSIQAKQAGIYPIGVIGSTIGTISGLAGNFVNLNLIVSPSPRTIIALGLFLTIFAFVLFLSVRWLARQQPFLAFLPLFALVMIAFYATSGTLVFGYYHANYDVFARIAWWVGLYLLAKEVIARSRNISAFNRYARMFGTVTLVIALLPSLSTFAASVFGLPTDSQSSGDTLRQFLYRDLAHHLKPFVPEDTVILMPEIGELGFILDQVKVLDAAGLVSPEAIPYLPIPPDQRAGLGIGAIPIGLVHDYRPDMLIFFDIFALNGIGSDPWFWDNYTPVIVHEVNLPGWDSNALYVFARNDFQPGLQLPVFTSNIR